MGKYNMFQTTNQQVYLQKTPSRSYAVESTSLDRPLLAYLWGGQIPLRGFSSPSQLSVLLLVLRLPVVVERLQFGKE